MDTVNTASCNIETVEVFSHLNLNEEEGNSEDVLLHPSKEKYYNLPSGETEDIWPNYH